MIVALAATLAATAGVALVPEPTPTMVAAMPTRQPAPRSAAPAVPSQGSAAALSLPITVEPRAPWPDVDPAALGAWMPPPPATAPAAVASAPAAPVVPGFPYRWIGRLDDGPSRIALLAGPQRSVGVRAGDVIDGSWRVDTIADTRIELTWLPGGDTRVLELR
jgi:hypothetical protein